MPLEVLALVDEYLPLFETFENRRYRRLILSWPSFY